MLHCNKMCLLHSFCKRAEVRCEKLYEYHVRFEYRLAVLLEFAVSRGTRHSDRLAVDGEVRDGRLRVRHFHPARRARRARFHDPLSAVRAGGTGAAGEGTAKQK